MICPKCGNPYAYVDMNRDGDGRDYIICPECGVITSDQHFDDDECGYLGDDSTIEKQSEEFEC